MSLKISVNTQTTFGFLSWLFIEPMLEQMQEILGDTKLGKGCFQTYTFPR